MLALTIKQPYAQAILLGLKRQEYRTWTTPHRGILLIHAGKSFADEGATNFPDIDGPRGAIIGTVEITDVVPHAGGNWAWVLTNPRRIEPVACSGQLWLWTPGEKQLREVERQLRVTA